MRKTCLICVCVVHTSFLLRGHLLACRISSLQKTQNVSVRGPSSAEWAKCTRTQKLIGSQARKMTQPGGYDDITDTSV